MQLWTFKIRGEKVTFTILETEVAVKSSGVSDKDLNQLAHRFGKLIENRPSDETVRKGAESERDIFIKAGWRFVVPLPEIALAAKLGSTKIDAASVHQVILSDTGARFITTDLATVRFSDETLSLSQATELLAEDGLSIVYRLGFAPNTFEVRLRSEISLRETIATLQAKTERYRYAEPSLVQVLDERRTPIGEPGIQNGDQWQHLDKGLRSLDAWAITKGARKHRVRVAVIDSGMNITLSELAPGIVNGGYYKEISVGMAEFVPLKPGTVGFPLTVDHGTFCLGLVGARLNGHDGCGIAPEADLIPIACPIDKTGTQTTLARAVHYAADPSFEDKSATPDQGADVISCSLDTRKLLQSSLYDAFTFATSKGRGGKGVPVFWAVNNEDEPIALDKIFSHLDVIAVAQHNSARERVNSAFGQRLEYLAPGQDVFSIRSFGNFAMDSGTSYATPLAAGVAALVLSIRPEWTVNEVRKHLQESCEPPGTKDDQNGHGCLIAALAVQNAKPPDL